MNVVCTFLSYKVEIVSLKGVTPNNLWGIIRKICLLRIVYPRRVFQERKFRRNLWRSYRSWNSARCTIAPMKEAIVHLPLADLLLKIGKLSVKLTQVFMGAHARAHSALVIWPSRIWKLMLTWCFELRKQWHFGEACLEVMGPDGTERVLVSDHIHGLQEICSQMYWLISMCYMSWKYILVFKA